MNAVPAIPGLQANVIVRKQLGKRIRTIRKECRFTQSTLASLCKMHVSHLSKVERGEANATLSTWLALALSLHITLGDLFHGITHDKSEDG